MGITYLIATALLSGIAAPVTVPVTLPVTLHVGNHASVQTPCQQASGWSDQIIATMEGGPATSLSVIRRTAASVQQTKAENTQFHQLVGIDGPEQRVGLSASDERRLSMPAIGSSSKIRSSLAASSLSPLTISFDWKL